MSRLYSAETNSVPVFRVFMCFIFLSSVLFSKLTICFSKFVFRFLRIAILISKSIFSKIKNDVDERTILFSKTIDSLFYFLFAGDFHTARIANKSETIFILKNTRFFKCVFKTYFVNIFLKFIKTFFKNGDILGHLCPKNVCFILSAFL